MKNGLKAPAFRFKKLKTFYLRVPTPLCGWNRTFLLTSLKITNVSTARVLARQHVLSPTLIQFKKEWINPNLTSSWIFTWTDQYKIFEVCWYILKIITDNMKLNFRFAFFFKQKKLSTVMRKIPCSRTFFSYPLS